MNKNKIQMKNIRQISENKINLTNQIVYVELIAIRENEIKQLNFIGLCALFRKKSGSFIIKNSIKKEIVTFTLNIQSPLVLKLTGLTIYRKKIKLKKMK